MSQEGVLIRSHLPCEACGSSDAKAEYSTGEHCFSCGAHNFEESDEIPVVRPKLGLIEGIAKGLDKRGINEDTCRKFGYKIGSYRDTPAHIAPYFKDGQLVAQHLRTADKKFPWLGDSQGVELFGQNLWKAQGDNSRLIITEGELDCMSVSQVLNNRWPVVSLPSGAGSADRALRDNIEFIESFNDVVIAFDNDDAGREATDMALQIISAGKLRVVKFPEGIKDANDMVKSGKAGQLVGLIFQAAPYRPDGILNGTELWDVVSTPITDGIGLPYPMMSSMLRGLRKGIYFLTAGSGVGKSTLVHEMAYHLLMEHKEKIGVVALEDSTQKTALRYPSLYLNKRLDLESVPEEKLREAFDATINNDKFYMYDHFGSLESDNLMSKIRFMIKGMGIKYIILDHVSIVISGMDVPDERKAIDKLMTDLRSLAEETDACFLVIGHINRSGNNANEGGQITLRDLRGSSALEGLSDAVIALERDQQAEGNEGDISQIRILKNRITGDLGLADTLKYYKDTGRLLPEYLEEFELVGEDFEDEE
jgi:twinkle protein